MTPGRATFVAQVAVAIVVVLAAVSCSTGSPSTRIDDVGVPGAASDAAANGIDAAPTDAGANAGVADSADDRDAGDDAPDSGAVSQAPSDQRPADPIDDGRPSGELLIQRRAGGEAWVSAVDISTETETRLSSGAVAVSRAVWSPDGSRIVWAEQAVGEPGTSIVVVEPGGTNPQVVSSGAIETFPTWSPDCASVAFSLLDLDDGAGELVIVGLDSGERRSVGWGPGVQAWPDWSADGTTLVYQSERGGDTEIALVSVDGIDERVLTDNTVGDTSPSWSPDGSRIAFASRVNERKQIFVLDPDTGEVDQVTGGTEGGSFPVWSPDGEWLVYELPDGKLAMRQVNGDDRIELDVVGQPTSWRPTAGTCR